MSSIISVDILIIILENSFYLYLFLQVIGDVPLLSNIISMFPTFVGILFISG